MINEAERQDLFRAEITKLFLAYNKPVIKQVIDAKAVLMNETLSTLKTYKIQEFFKYVRTSEDVLPNDGTLLKILRQNAGKFKEEEFHQKIEHAPKLTGQDKATLKMYASRYPDFEDLFLESLEDEDLYPSQDWHRRFMARMQDRLIMNRVSDIAWGLKMNGEL